MYDFFIPMTIFTFVGAFTPGPNNLLATASGANFGYPRTLPLILGVVLGYSVLFTSVAVGLGELFLLYPSFHAAIRYLGAAYLLVLAFKIATAGASTGAKVDEKIPLTWVQAALFQCVNPKAWTIAITLVATFTTAEDYLWRTAVILAVNIVVAFLAMSTWTLFGQIISSFLEDPRRLKIFNFTMGGLLVGTCMVMLIGG